MVKKTEFIWNMIASVSASLLSVILLFVVTRVNGVVPAGMFSIAFASATVLNSIADFGMRVYQVTDTNRQYSFGIYLSSRFVVDVFMLLCGIVFVIVSGYSIEKAAICLGLVGFRFVDAISETYQGEFQVNGRLDIAGKTVFYRILVSIIVFTISDIITGNIVFATCTMLVTNLLGLILYDVRYIKRFTLEQISFHKKEIFQVIKDCFPLFLSTFLNNYIVNAPKYAIDKLLTYEIQTYFNILYLPTFTINLMSIFVLKPMLRGLGENWNNNKHKKFLGIINKMGVAIVVMTLLVEVICCTIGLPILSFIYGVELQQYRRELVILVASGGFSALSVMLFYALSTMRVQKKAGVAYIMSALGGLILPGRFVSKWGITGAAVSSVVIMIILSVILTGIFIMEWRNSKNYEG